MLLYQVHLVPYFCLLLLWQMCLSSLFWFSFISTNALSLIHWSFLIQASLSILLLQHVYLFSCSSPPFPDLFLYVSSFYFDKVTWVIVFGHTLYKPSSSYSSFVAKVYVNCITSALLALRRLSHHLEILSSEDSSFWFIYVIVQMLWWIYKFVYLNLE